MGAMQRHLKDAQPARHSQYLQGFNYSTLCIRRLSVLIFGTLHSCINSDCSLWLSQQEIQNLKILLSALFCTLIAVNLIHNSIILKESFRIGELQLTSISKEKISDRSAQEPFRYIDRHFGK